MTEQSLQEEITLIRTLLDPEKHLTDEQIKIFISIAKEKKLDPKLNQICLRIRNKKPVIIQCI